MCDDVVWTHNSATFSPGIRHCRSKRRNLTSRPHEQAGTITECISVKLPVLTTTSNRYLFMDEVNFGTTATDVGAIAPVPEPTSIGLLTLGSLALVARRRKT